MPQNRTRWSCLLLDMNGIQGLIGSSSTTTPSLSPTPPFEPWPNVIAEGGTCRSDGSTGTCAAGLTCELGLSGASTCVWPPAPTPSDQTLNGAAPDQTSNGAAPDQTLNGAAPEQVSTKTTEAITMGDTTLMLERQTGIVVGSVLTIFSADGTSEQRTIAELEDGQFTLESPLANSYPSGSGVVVVKASAEPEEEEEASMPEEELGIKKTNHFTTLRDEISQGVTELPVMSFRGFRPGDSIFIEASGAPGEAKEVTAVIKTSGDFKLVVRTPTSNAYPREATVTQLEEPGAGEPSGGLGEDLGAGQEW